jgi:hypothetical protein
MKKTIVQAICPVLLSLLIISCNSSSSKEGMQKDLQEKAQNALKTESKKEPETNTSNTTPQNAMSVADAKKFIAAADANKEKEITVSAYPRGTTKPINGEFMLYVSDKTGTGLPEENFACKFKEDMKEQVRTHKAGELVKVSGNIAYNNGMVILKNAKLVD